MISDDVEQRELLIYKKVDASIDQIDLCTVDVVDIALFLSHCEAS